MYYHAQLLYGDAQHFWWNHSEQKITANLLIPFVNGQVAMISIGGKKRLLNMKSVSVLKLFKTKEKLTEIPDSTFQARINEPSFEANNCTEEMIAKVQLAKSFKPTTSLLEKAFQTPKEQVFVIMKFGDETLDSAYEGAYKTVAAEFGLDCIRIDEVQDSGKISDQILEHIAESKFIVADLSGNRPNCYYECGFAHALGKNLILSINAHDKIHFDLAGHRFIVWKTESELRNLLKKRFAALTDKRPSSAAAA